MASGLKLAPRVNPDDARGLSLVAAESLRRVRDAECLYPKLLDEMTKEANRAIPGNFAELSPVEKLEQLAAMRIVVKLLKAQRKRTGRTASRRTLKERTP